jgi:hypothetical protein
VIINRSKNFLVKKNRKKIYEKPLNRDERCHEIKRVPKRESILFHRKNTDWVGSSIQKSHVHVP